MMTKIAIILLSSLAIWSDYNWGYMSGMVAGIEKSEVKVSVAAPHKF
jgi:hypothetical protein